VCAQATNNKARGIEDQPETFQRRLFNQQLRKEDTFVYNRSAR